MVSLAANRNDGPLTWENDHYLQDASYIRLKNITVDYTFPKPVSYTHLSGPLRPRRR